jgi:hypothetical protein
MLAAIRLPTARGAAMDTGSSCDAGMGDRADEIAAASGHGWQDRGQRTAAHSHLTTSELPDGDDEAMDHPGDETDEAQASATGGTRGPGPLKEKVLHYNRFIDDTLKGLEPMTAVVWFVLFRFARGGVTWASQKTIADRMGVDPKTVMRHLTILKKKQLVRVVKQGTRGGRANTYQLGILPLDKRPKPKRSSPRKPR